MFLSHISFALELIAIAMGVSFLIWSLRTEGAGTSFAKAMGVIIIVLAVFDLLCTVYSTILYSHFANPRSFMMPYGQSYYMMNNDMGMMPMMGGAEMHTPSAMPTPMCPMCALMMQNRMNGQAAPLPGMQPPCMMRMMPNGTPSMMPVQANTQRGVHGNTTNQH